MTRARTNADNALADILGVTASTGLTGGGTSGTVSVSIDTATAYDYGANAVNTIKTSWAYNHYSLSYSETFRSTAYTPKVDLNPTAAGKYKEAFTVPKFNKYNYETPISYAAGSFITYDPKTGKASNAGYDGP